MDGTTMTTTLSAYNEGILSGTDPLGKNVPNLTAIQDTSILRGSAAAKYRQEFWRRTSERGWAHGR